MNELKLLVTKQAKNAQVKKKANKYYFTWKAVF